MPFSTAHRAQGTPLAWAPNRHLTPAPSYITSRPTIRLMMEAWGIQDHASRFVIIPNPEDTSRTTTPCHQRNYSESSLSSLASFHGPPTPPSSSSSPCFPASPAVSYCVGMSQEEEGPLVYTTDSPMGGGSEYDYPGGSQGYYVAPHGGSSSDGARYVESPQEHGLIWRPLV